MVLLAPYSQWFRSHRPERAPVQLAKSHVLKRISGASRRYGFTVHLLRWYTFTYLVTG